jgi:polyisoprenoid-binding protein YceI
MRKLWAFMGAGLLAFSATATAETEQYEIDKGHTFVTFQASHIGYAWIPGTFDDVSGTFTYDPDNRPDSSVEFTINIKSLDTDHTKRDKHLRSDEFFHASKYPEATFKSSSYEPTGEDTAVMTGDLTIKGVTREVELQVKELEAGVDPWDNYRRAFEATTTLNIDDFNLDPKGQLPPGTKDVDLRIAVEALRQ